MTPARSMAVDRLIVRREVHLREKTLYETAGRSEEILGINIEWLDLVGRRWLGKADWRARRRRASSRPMVRRRLPAMWWSPACIWTGGRPVPMPSSTIRSGGRGRLRGRLDTQRLRAYSPLTHGTCYGATRW